MIHAALWVASFLFLLYVGACVLGLLVLAWRWVLGALAIVVLLVVVAVNANQRSNPRIDASKVQWDRPAAYAPVSEPNPLTGGLPLPSHAIADVANPGAWECMATYQRIGNACVAVSLPPDAQYDKSEQGWRCSLGFVQEADRCEPLPLNADGCARGFRWETDGCYPSSIPEHAIESYTGGWDCVVGYVKRNDKCVQN